MHNLSECILSQDIVVCMILSLVCCKAKEEGVKETTNPIGTTHILIGYT
jgi:hypothetical protein